MKKSKNIISESIENIPLETTLRVLNEMAFINLIVELGYRESKMWTEDEHELLNKLLKLANEHTDDILKEIEKL